MADVPVSLATVYNTLHQFTDAGLLREVVLDGSKTYFDTNVTDHHHFFIEDDNVMLGVPEDALGIDRLPTPPPGMEISRVDVVIRLRRIKNANSAVIRSFVGTRLEGLVGVDAQSAVLLDPAGEPAVAQPAPAVVALVDRRHDARLELRGDGGRQGRRRARVDQRAILAGPDHAHAARGEGAPSTQPSSPLASRTRRQVSNSCVTSTG